ncbi:MAG: glycosyltransferase family 2 protein [Acidimicrobiales bacterium]
MSRAVGVASFGATALTLHTFRNLARLRRPAPSPQPSSGLVSVLLPARDEAVAIGPAVRAILASEGVDLELIVLDDGSVDGTAAVVRAVARADPRVRILSGAEPPGGWLGKPYACQRLADASSGAVLAFVDADVVLAPQALCATVDLLRRHNLQLVSPYPRQLVSSPAERLVQPLLQWSWLTFLPLRAAESPRWPSMTAANGQLLACDAAAYRTSGGHGAVRHAVIEDVWLARAFKRHGFRATVADGTTLADCRMYGSWSELRDGYTKSLWSAFGSPAGAVTVTGLLLFLYVLPPLAALRAIIGRRPRQALPGAVGWGAAVAGRVAAARATGGRPVDGLAHPLSIVALGALTGRSLRARRAGRLSWKGRSLHG